jgi:hypothetical protein
MEPDAEVFDLGWLARATKVLVHLDAVANVRLLTRDNVSAYRQRNAYRMTGGVALSPPFRISIPADGHWYVAVDTEGLEAVRLHAVVTVVG